MHRSCVILAGLFLAGWSVAAVPQPVAQHIDLAAQLAAGKLRAVNRDVSKGQDRSDAVHVSDKLDPGLVWIDGISFADGAIEVDVRGRDLLQRSFLGIAFHGRDDQTYECVYLRPFNFRAPDAARKRHAAQYMMLPAFDWPKLREQFPEEFEGGVDQAIAPIAWVTLKVVVQGAKVEAYAGPSATPVLNVRKLGDLSGGRIALWTGNNSDGDFANLRITPAK